jgi:hypothetical protein
MFKRRVNLSDQITIICEVMGFVAVHVKTAFIAMIRRFAQTQEFQTFSYERPLFVCYSLAGYSQALPGTTLQGAWKWVNFWER